MHLHLVRVAARPKPVLPRPSKVVQLEARRPQAGREGRPAELSRLGARVWENKEGGRMRSEEIVEHGTILRATVGSTVHGLHHGGQDERDEMAVFIEPPEYLLGLARARGIRSGIYGFEHYVARTQPEGVRSGPGDLDLVAYSLRKYVRLALKGHPTILLLLFVPEELILAETQLGKELRELRPALLSRRAGRGYLGYLGGQKERLLGTRGQRRVNRPGTGGSPRFRHEVRNARRPARLPGARAARDWPADAADAGAGALARDGDPHRRADVRGNDRRDRRGRAASCSGARAHGATARARPRRGRPLSCRGLPPRLGLVGERRRAAAEQARRRRRPKGGTYDGFHAPRRRVLLLSRRASGAAASPPRRTSSEGRAASKAGRRSYSSGSATTTPAHAVQGALTRSGAGSRPSCLRSSAEERRASNPGAEVRLLSGALAFGGSSPRPTK